MSSNNEGVPGCLVNTRSNLFHLNDESFSALGIHTGDCAVVRYGPVRCGSLAAVMTPDCGPIMRIVCFQEGAIRLRALNPLFRDLWYSPSQVSIIGAVENVRSQNKGTLRFPSPVTVDQPLLDWAADANGRITDVSEMLGLASGQDPRVFLGDLKWLELVHPEEQERAASAWRRSLRTGENFSEHFHLRSLLGGYMKIHSTARVVLSDSGNFERWIGAVRIAAPLSNEQPGRFFYPKQAVS